MTATLFSPRSGDDLGRPAATRPGAAPAVAAPGSGAGPAADVPRTRSSTETSPRVDDGAAVDVATTTGVDGYVLFRVGDTAFAVAVSEVREVIRAARIELLPTSGRQVSGRSLALVDARGRSIPVLDLRHDRETAGDVLLPLWRRHVGVVVDRVLSVRSPRELVRETEDVPEALPSYARGVLRPADGGSPVLLIAMPDVPELEADARRVDEPRLGEDVLTPDEDLIIAS